ncbi:MAG: Flagellar biosynthesis protein FliS [uncultured Quadrisphaera sp.]|uniref:Flagellar biosynthesis protein FliS n=1 Tax=uncultured Quadrisphaera sp. TaxID=904978 RepID=A0A6J4P7S3_9ACTN|nr:MAG: Flagellar biosynthesis protein FliS [uncultured Quadrisphaera sp.]
MPTIAAQRAAFATTAASTASPQSLLVMLYDRLVLDLERAEHAQRTGEVGTAHTNLVHAQDIVTELAVALDADAWDGGPGLAALYAWLRTELVSANVTKDAETTAACREVVVPLRDAWREAVAGTPAAGPAAARPAARAAALGGTA